MTDPKDKKKKKTAPEGKGGGEQTLSKKDFLEALDAVIDANPKPDEGKKKTSE